MSRRGLSLLALPCLLVAFGRPAHAVCDVPPAATGDFRAGVGSTNRPFASPGDTVEVRVRPTVCDRGSSGYVDLDADGAVADDYVVTVIFTPPSGGPATAVSLAESPTGLDLVACEAQLGPGGSASSLAMNTPQDPQSLSVLNARELQFRFPDTDELLVIDGVNDDATLTGPAKIVVTRRGAPLPCGLATTRCADSAGTTQSTGVVACIDEIYALDGTCDQTIGDIDPLFSHFTALPPPNNLEAMISQPGNTPVNLTIDAEGHVLIPMDYSGVLVRIGDERIPVPQLARVTTSAEAFSGGGVAISLPSAAFASSYAANGVSVDPTFAPLQDSSASSEAVLFGSVDAPRGVLRLSRRGCLGGADEGFFCTANPDCSSNVCSSPLFDFSTRLASSVGPIRLTNADYSAEIEGSVPIEGLLQNSEAFTFVLSEGIDGIDRNGDSDTTDFVATLRRRDTNEIQQIGDAGSDGRAVTMLRNGEFRFPAVESEGELLAFLESEAAQDSQDSNGNGQIFDSVMRVYQLGTTQADELTDPLAPTTAEASFGVAGGAFSLTEGELYFATDESSIAARETTVAGVSSVGVQTNDTSYLPDLSVDGRYVAFHSAATNLVSGDTNNQIDVFVRDRLTGSTERVSVSSFEVQGNDTSTHGVVSGDGRYVAFHSRATNLVSGDTNGVGDIFLRDRLNGTTERISVSSLGVQADAISQQPTMSPDGRYVAFSTAATALVTGDTNATTDVFVRDRLAGTTERVSLSSGGAQGDLASGNGFISADGRIVAFYSSATTLVPNDTNARIDAFVRDRTTGLTERISVSSAGTEGDGHSWGPEGISGDGRYVVFRSSATNLVPGDTNGVTDMFVHDRGKALTERISVSSAGVQGDQDVSFDASISGDGRYVAFGSYATNLVPGDTNDGLGFLGLDVFLRDRLAGLTQRMSVSSAGAQADDISDFPTLSADGRYIAFESDATNLVIGLTNGEQNILTRGPLFSGSADLTGDGDMTDVVLRCIDTTLSAPIAPDTLCPMAGALETALGRAAFLRDESAGAAAGCGDNDDLDSDDLVVHLADGASVTNLRCAASEVAISDTHIVSLVSEEGENSDLDGDSNVEPVNVLHTRAVSDGAPGSCPGNWNNSGVRGHSLVLVEDSAALLVAETEGGASQDLDQDGDTSGQVVRLVDAATASPVTLQDLGATPLTGYSPSAENFVLGSKLLAFHTSENAETGFAGNGDGDTDDFVLRVIELSTGTLVNTGQAMRPCELAACNPERPYRVAGDTVRFISLEQDQGTLGGTPDCDLNDDGDCGDLLVQVYHFPTGLTRIVSEVVEPSDPSAGSDPLAGPSDDDSGDPKTRPGQVIVSSGRCVEDQQVACTVGLGDCAGGELCVAPVGLTSGTCVIPTGATCNPDLPPAETGCDTTASCVEDGTVIGVADGDDDQVPDALDNCPNTSNPTQSDADSDGVGDACDLESQLCGNGSLETFEACDDGDIVPGDGCGATCQIEAATLCTGSPSICVADTDGDGLSDADEIGIYGTDPNLADSDGEGLDDGLEVLVHGTDPLLPDTDGDGSTDLEEVQNGTDPLVFGCGDASIDPPEECDDSNATPGDGCSAICRIESGWNCSGTPSECTAAGPQTRFQQICTNEQNKNGSLVAKERGKQIDKCARAYAAGPARDKLSKLGVTPFSVSACFGVDLKGKLAFRKTKLADKQQLRCIGTDKDGITLTPAYGYQDESLIAPAAEAAPLSLFDDLYGPDGDLALVFQDTFTADKQSSLCQLEVWKRTQKVHDELWKEARKAKKLAMKGKGPDKTTIPAPSFGAELSDAIEAWLAADPNGKLAKREGHLLDKGGDRCADAAKPIGSTLPELFPGSCAVPAAVSFGDLATCAVDAARCRFCESLNAADDFDIDCDAFDDGASNTSCP